MAYYAGGNKKFLVREKWAEEKNLEYNVIIITSLVGVCALLVHQIASIFTAN